MDPFAFSINTKLHGLKMGLTRTRFISADTSKAKLEDPITLLNSDSTVANVDVGFLINRNLGVKSNVAMIWSESGNTFVVAFTDDTGITNSNLNVSSYANVTAGTIIVNSLKTDNFLYSNGNPFSAPAASYTQTFVADNLSSGNAVFATARITGNLQVEGNIFTIGQQNLSISDSVIDLHTQANLAPWTFNDGKDIGIKFHYYDYQDEHAFLGRVNTTGYLEWYDSGREVGNVFTGNTYGTIKTGELVIANATVSSNTVTGALRVSGGAGILGRLNVGGNIVANSGAASSSTTTGAMIVRGGAGISGDTYIGGALTAASLQNTAIGTVTPNSGYFNDLYNTLTLKSGGNIVAYSGTASTDTTSGALVVVGGAGISGNVYVNSVYTAQGIRWSNNNATVRGITITSNTAPPLSGNVVGDRWYNTSNDILYEYVNDGSSLYWVDISSQTIAANTSNVISGNLTVNGNASITSNLVVTQSGLFRGPYNENSTLSGVFVGNTGTAPGITPRVGFFNGNTQQNWQIDNNAGEFRWFVPGATRLSLYPNGNLNVVGSLTVGGKKAVNGPAFRAYISTGQTIASAGAQVKVTFGGETFDTDGCFASSAFTPTVEGYYQLNATVRIAGTAGTGENMLVLYKNGGEYARGTNGSGTEIGANFYSMQVSDIVYANGTGDYFEVYIQQGSGSNRDTTAGTNISYFSGCMIRGA